MNSYEFTFSIRYIILKTRVHLFLVTLDPPSQQYQEKTPSFTVQLEDLLSFLRRHIDAIQKPGFHVVP